MKNKRLISLFICVVGMLFLILDAKTALSSATEGIAICVSTVIPSLFPFFILSAILNTLLFGWNIPFLRPLSKLCRIPEGTESILLLGLLGGYPVGAMGIRQGYDAGVLSKKDSQRMLGFCNNAGPAFIFGMLLPIFGNIGYCAVLWIIHMVSAVLVGILLPGGNTKPASIPSKAPLTMSQAMYSGIRSMANVCGWVIIFRVLIGFMDRWFLWIFPPTLALLFSGFLEMTNGCLSILQVDALSLRFLLAAGFVSFGGVCVAMQTASVVGTLSLRNYYFGKLLQTVITSALSTLFLVIFTLL